MAEGVANLLVAIFSWIFATLKAIARKLARLLKISPRVDHTQVRKAFSPDTHERWMEQAAEKVLDFLISWHYVLGNFFGKFSQRIFRFFGFFIYLNWTTIKKVAICTVEQRLPGLSAEMAYHSVLALFPALLTVVSAISLSESLQSTLYEMASLLAAVVPQEVQNLIGNIWRQMTLSVSSSEEVFSFSFLISIWLFSGAISAAIAALNHIHQVPRHRLRPFWQSKLIALGLAVGTLSLLVVASSLVFISDLIVEILARKSCILETIGSCPLDQIQNCLEQPPVQSCLLEQTVSDTWKQLRWPITLGIVSINFGLIYRYGPSERQLGTPIIPGAILAAVLWAVISNLFRWYVSNFGNYNITYGTIGTFIIMLLWLYISCLVMLLGAQLNVTVGEAMGNRRPKRPLILPPPSHLRK